MGSTDIGIAGALYKESFANDDSLTEFALRTYNK